MSNKIYEIAVRKIKAGKDEEFIKAREAFIAELKKQDGAETDREFKSFFSIPQPDDTDVFVGMTRWESIEAFAKAGEKLMPTETAQNFFSTFDMKAYVQAVPVKGNFDIDTVAKDGQILEIAVRTWQDGKKEEFEKGKLDFVELLTAQDGVVADYEFKVLGENLENLSVGMTVYENQEKFNKIADPKGIVMTSPIAGKFLGELIKPKALQFCIAIKQ